MEYLMDNNSAPAQDVMQYYTGRILSILDIYPYLNRSMLHISIGSSIPATALKASMASLVETGKVVVEEIVAQSLAGRSTNQTIYRLATTPTHPKAHQPVSDN